MATSYRDYTSPNTQFTYDLRNNTFFRKDAGNFIDALGIQQLNTLGNTSLLDIFLTTGNVIEPHIHQNASELVYCVTGEAIVSIINPFTNQLLNFNIKPRQVANVPQGWWHYEVALTDDTHLIAIFDAPVPEVIFGSDILRLTPASIWAHTYCLDEAKVKDTFAPITRTVVIGPPLGCQQGANPAPNQGQSQWQHTSSQYPHYDYSSQYSSQWPVNSYYDAAAYTQPPEYGQYTHYPELAGYTYYSPSQPQTAYPQQYGYSAAY
ncbi:MULTISPECIES: cupin domain-containing protein [Brevibacillus]|uniref:cupin domain-containing protein n=1 Tax=Brevibacillus TaxID=55080 RepID=UPI0003F750FE|nr:MULTISPECIES: cupin domain-containing protein [Brevibacillus]MDN4095822.1 cupin domain-containing protein [Brevibacillus agri]MDR9507050.1 cupin domain-containing protein [Brevibacillus agri]QHZ57367.1 cupin domain-containing protein [Brevibacillus sp. NSP2.1]WHX32532.1 cupin domain-containing protein [Brevibacillus agri]